MLTRVELASLLELAGGEQGCDKIYPHGYHKYYADHLIEFYDRPFKLLEIGIGGEGNELGGASLKMWEKVFPNAEIYAIDIFEKRSLDSKNIRTFVVDQGDESSLKAFAEQYGPFDVIIDDGSHRRADQLTSLFTLINHVAAEGFYVLEDYFTSYWPVYDGSSLAKDFLDTPVRWLKQTIDIINRENLLSETVKSQIPNWPVTGLHVYPGVAFLRLGAQSGRSAIPNIEFKENQIELDRLRYGEYETALLEFAKDPMSNLAILSDNQSRPDEESNS